MGKFKEIDRELKESSKKRNKLVNSLVIQYPFMKDFIQQAFDFGDEDKVFEVIFALETNYLPC